ncbi:MAG: preprotein translocase subunit YajC [Clostridia bacterium]|nr:preprotein translocase subunit YajC [Clostridia bacterium]
MLNFLALTADTAATGATGDATQQAGALASLMPFILMGLLFVVMYFLMIRPQKKKQKEEQKMRESIRVGDEITTIGGIRGRIVNIKEDEFVIETGADRNKMVIKKWALQSCDTVHDGPADDDDDDDDDI